MSEGTLDLQQLGALARRYVLLFAVLIAVGTGAGVGASFLVTKKFKSLAVLNLQAGYFRIPLVNDLISGSSESETQAQKDALLRAAINDEFLETLGREHNSFKHPENSLEHIAEREGFRKRIEYFPMTSTAIQFGVVASDADVSVAMTREVLERVIETLVAERVRVIRQYRESLVRQIQPIRKSAPESSDTMELGALEAQIAVLEREYTPEHPTITGLREKAEALRRSSRGSGHSRTGGAPLNPQSGEALLRDDLVRKVKYLDIALEIEKDREHLPYLSVLQKPVRPVKPTWPKLPNFALGGGFLGLIIALILSVYEELKKMSAYTPAMAAQSLGVPYLGELPKCLMPSGGLIEVKRGSFDPPIDPRQ